jgi:hypothetical protein
VATHTPEGMPILTKECILEDSQQFKGLVDSVSEAAPVGHEQEIPCAVCECMIKNIEDENPLVATYIKTIVVSLRLPAPTCASVATSMCRLYAMLSEQEATYRKG